MFFFFKQKTAYEMRISDWSSDVCSSDLLGLAVVDEEPRQVEEGRHPGDHRQNMQGFHPEIRRAEESRHPVPLLILPLAGSPASRPGRGGPRPGSRPAVPPWPNRQPRSEARHEGKECVSTCRSRGSPYH